MDLFEVLEQISDVEALKKSIYTIKVGQILEMDSFKISRNRYYELENEHEHSLFKNIESLLEHIKNHY